MTAAEPENHIIDLRCEGLIDPLGIDSTEPRLSWRVNPSRQGKGLSAFQVRAATERAFLSQGKADLWDSGKIASEQCLCVRYGGNPLQSRMNCFWEARIWDQEDRASGWSPAASWSMGLLKESDWSAQWIGQPENGKDMTSPWLRRAFTVPSAPAGARAYVNTLGYCELYINGTKAGDDVLSPHVCDPGKRSYYITYDVTDLLRTGDNCIGAWLGRGWYHRGLLWPVAHSGPAVRIELNWTDGSGRVSTLITDETWKAHPSCIRLVGEWKASDFGGECYDAGAELPEWNRTELDDSDWADAVIVRPVDVPAHSQMVPPNRITGTFSPADISLCGDSGYLVDMGRAMTGWFEIRLPAGERGQGVAMEFGDSINGETLNSFNQRSEYIYRGKGREVFRGRFNYASFRYVKLTGMPGAPGRKDITGHFITTDLQRAGWFSCSHKTLSAIHDTMHHTLRCLMLGGYQVDCHSRERLGYGGDGQSSLETTLTMMRADAFYRKWTADWLDAQRPDGGLPHTAPCPYKAGGGPFWCGFPAAVSWRHYLHYGDRDLLQRNYPAVVKWLDYVEQHTESGLLHRWPDTEYRHWYLGDWATPEGIDEKHGESVDLFCNCYVIHAMELTARIADALGRNEDVRRWNREAQQRRPVVHRTFFNPDTGTYADGDQIDLIMPLLADVVPQELRGEVFRKFEHELLAEHGGHLATGLSGTCLMIQYLQEIGRDDLIFRFAAKTDEPSWGAMISRGGTAVWEYWDGRCSRIHNCYNSIGSWFQQGLAGIRPDPEGPGFMRVILHPAIVGDLTFVKARYDSIRGPIESSWSIIDNTVQWDISIPPGVTASAQVPAASADTITVNGTSPADAENIQLPDAAGPRVNIGIHSGRYTLVFPVP